MMRNLKLEERPTEREEQGRRVRKPTNDVNPPVITSEGNKTQLPSTCTPSQLITVDRNEALSPTMIPPPPNRHGK